MVTGQVTQPEYGSQDEPVSFSVEEQPYSDRNQIPDTGAILSEARFGDQGMSGYTGIDPDFEGLYGPIVFGTPGKWVNTSGGDAITSGSFGIPILRDASGYVERVLVASHHVVGKHYSGGGYSANEVRVWDSAGLNGDNWQLVNASDDQGRHFAYALAPGSTPVDKLETEFRIGWGFSPALLGDEGDTLTSEGAPTGAGDILLWLLRRSSLRVDVGRWEAARIYLNRFEFSGYIDEAVSPWQYIQDNILPLLPRIPPVSPPRQAQPLSDSRCTRHAAGSSSRTLAAGHALRRGRTSLRYSQGSMALTMQLPIKENQVAAVVAPPSEPANIQFLRATTG